MFVNLLHVYVSLSEHVPLCQCLINEHILFLQKFILQLLKLNACVEDYMHICKKRIPHSYMEALVLRDVKNDRNANCDLIIK